MAVLRVLGSGSKLYTNDRSSPVADEIAPACQRLLGVGSCLVRCTNGKAARRASLLGSAFGCSRPGRDIPLAINLATDMNFRTGAANGRFHPTADLKLPSLARQQADRERPLKHGPMCWAEKLAATCPFTQGEELSVYLGPKPGLSYVF